MNTIKPILEGIYNNPISRKTVIPLFMGNTGLGKTTIIKQFAKDKGVKLVSFITSQRMPYEVSGMAMADKETKKMAIWDFDTLLSMKDGDILLADELYNGIPATLNAMLTLLEEREMISGKKLPDIMIVAAANPQGMPPLTPQIRSRFWQYNVKFNRKLWMDYMWNKYKMPKSISSKLSNLIINESFDSYNYATPKDYDKATNAIINNITTPFDNHLIPILSTLVTNNLKGDVIINDTVIKQNEKIEWLKLIKLSYGNITK